MPQINHLVFNVYVFDLNIANGSGAATIIEQEIDYHPVSIFSKGAFLHIGLFEQLFQFFV